MRRFYWEQQVVSTQKKGRGADFLLIFAGKWQCEATATTLE